MAVQDRDCHRKGLAMKTNAKWILALFVGALFVAPSMVAEGQPRKIPPMQGKRPPSRLRVAPPAAPVDITFSGGTFQMGSNDGDADAKPAHTASVSPFKMQSREVTVAQYKSCVDAKKCSVPGSSTGCNWGQAGRDNHPINCVDYYQATNYCASLGMRLPTEQEWEFAAKSPDNRTYPWGATAPTTEPCWKTNASCIVGSHAAGRSASGLDDMSGNVAEWTASPFCPYQSGGCTTTTRAVRGGGWSLAVATEVQTSSRAGFNKGVRSATIGFRCVGAPAPQ